MYPRERIVCLIEETTETLYLLGEQHRIVGISGYTVRPPLARKEKPRVSAFISADIPKILALEPDLVLTFSDLQAEIVAALIRAGICVHAFNQRRLTGILDMIRTLGALVGATGRSRTGLRCLRNGHVAFGVLLLAVHTHDVELKFHSRRLRHARVTAITEVIRAFGFVAGLLAFASALSTAEPRWRPIV